MKIDKKYKLTNNLFSFKVIELLDFPGYPVLNLEQDTKTDELYLSYLIKYTHAEEIEQRIYIYVSNKRLQEIKKNKIILKEAFNNPEKSIVYMLNISTKADKIIDSYAIPKDDFKEINPIKDSYRIPIKEV